MALSSPCNPAIKVAVFAVAGVEQPDHVQERWLNTCPETPWRMSAAEI